MASSVGALVVLVGVVSLAAAASMWWRVLRDRGTDVQATVTDASVVESRSMNVEFGIDVAYEYWYDGRRYENRSVVHPLSVDDGDGGDDLDVPVDYREGASVTVAVPPDRPADGSLPDPGIRATYRVVVPALAASAVVIVGLGAWLAL